MNVATSLTQEPLVKIGSRVWRMGNWTRKDEVYLNGKRIGHIRLSDSDRFGTTVSKFNGLQKAGRDPAWCAEQATLAQLANVAANDNIS